MARKGESKAAELPKNNRALGLGFRRAWPRIFMHIIYVTDPAVGPTAGIVHQAKRIEVLDEIDNPWSVPLSPAFVIGDPHDNAGMIAVALDQGAQFGFELAGGFGS